MVSGFLRKVQSLPETFAPDLVRHCSEEMTHLAAFLPQLYAEMNPNGDYLRLEGRIIEKTDSVFEATIMGSLFNKMDPIRRPAKIIEAKSVRDIIETVKYAKTHGKKITVCSDGIATQI